MNRTQKIALRGMLIAVAFVLSWLGAAASAGNGSRH